MGNNITIYDVAHAAGVSPRTVSRYFNHPDKLAPRTAARLRETIARLGFRPNIFANRLSSGRAETVAVLMDFRSSQLPSPLHRRLLGHLSAELAARQRDLLLIGLPPANAAAVLAEQLSRQKFDALLLPTGLDAPMLELLATSPVPLVSLNWQPARPLPRWLYVGIDYYESSRAYALKLLQKGYRHIAYLAADSAAPAQRQQALFDTVAAFGAGATACCVKLAPTGDAARRAEQALAQVLQLSPRPQLLYCYSDWIALALLNATQRHGLQIPRDLAIAGFDGDEAASLLRPRLTTVVQPWAQMAAVAADILVDWDEQARHGKRVLPTEIRWGESA